MEAELPPIREMQEHLVVEEVQPQAVLDTLEAQETLPQQIQLKEMMVAEEDTDLV